VLAAKAAGYGCWLCVPSLAWRPWHVIYL
jgi:hypothetical protein